MDNLIDLECSEDFSIYSWEVDQLGINVENRLICEEKAFDLSLVSSITVDEEDDEVIDNISHL